MKKIFFVDGNLNAGGAERIFCTLVRNINATKYAVEVIITGRQGEMCSLLPNNIKVTYFNIKRSRYACIDLIKYFIKKKPDAVFCVSYNSAFAVLVAKFFCLRNFRISVRHCQMPRQKIHQGKIILNSIEFKIKRWLMNKLDCIIAEHKYMAEEIVDVYKFDPSKVCYVLNPVDEQLIDKQIQNESFSFPLNQINVVAAGRISYVKGFDFLINAFSKVIQQNNHFHLYIIGKDTENTQQELKKLAMTKNCINNIHFLGFQINPYIYFNAADIFVLSSKWEASPNVIFENLYLRKRIVSTNCSPILKDIIGTNGVLIEDGDEEAMKEAILNYKEYLPLQYKFNSLEDFYFQIIGNN